MTPTCTCRAAAPALRLVAALRDGAHLVSRPRSRSAIAHLHRGRLTPAGRVPRGTRPVCGTRTRTLAVLPADPTVLPTVLNGAGRRLCRRCMARTGPDGLVDAAGRHRCPFTQDERKAAFRHLTVEDLTYAARYAGTVDQAHEVGAVMTLLFGAKPMGPRQRLTGRRAALFTMHQVQEDRRRQLVADERTPEEVEQTRLDRAAEADHRRRVAEARRHDDAVDRARDRADRGGHLFTHERDLLADPIRRRRTTR